MKRKKHSKWGVDRKKVRKVFQWLFFAAFILISAVLIGESLTPGDQSAEKSDAAGDIISDVVDSVTEDTVQSVPPDTIEIRLASKQSSDGIFVGAGQAVKLTAALYPANTSSNFRKLKWTSSDTSVASVDAYGTVRGKKSGTCTITVSINVDGYEHISDTAEITVYETYATALSIHIQGAGEDIEMQTADSALVSMTFFPADTTNKRAVLKVAEGYDRSVVSFNGNYIVAKNEGTTKIYAEYIPADGSGDPVKSNLITVKVENKDGDEKPVELAGFEIALGALGEQHDGRYIMYAGESAPIPVTLIPSHTTQGLLIYTSSDPSVIDFSGDNNSMSVNALSKGRTTVTVTSASNKSLSKSFEVEVFNETLDALISLDNDIQGLNDKGDGIFELSVSAGTTDIKFLIDAAVDHFVSFSSSDPDVAEIADDGTLITYKSSGALKDKTVHLVITVADNAEMSSEGGNIVNTYTVKLTVEKQSIKDTISNFHLFIRKLFGHFGAFLVLGVAAAGTFILFSKNNWKSRIINSAVGFIYGFLLACVTELFQLPEFTPGRGSSFNDVLLDMEGFIYSYVPLILLFLLGAAIYCIVIAAKRKKHIRDVAKMQDTALAKTEVPCKQCDPPTEPEQKRTVTVPDDGRRGVKKSTPDRKKDAKK